MFIFLYLTWVANKKVSYVTEVTVLTYQSAIFVLGESRNEWYGRTLSVLWHLNVRKTSLALTKKKRLKDDYLFSVRNTKGSWMNPVETAWPRGYAANLYKKKSTWVLSLIVQSDWLCYLLPIQSSQECLNSCSWDSCRLIRARQNSTPPCSANS